MTKSKLTSASDVLQSLFQEGKSPLSEEFSRWQLWRKWPEIVGPTVAAQTDPVGFREGVLYVCVKNSVWIQQLTFVSKQLREKINGFLGNDKVKTIRFTTDRKSVPKLEDADVKFLNYLDKK